MNRRSFLASGGLALSGLAAAPVLAALDAPTTKPSKPEQPLPTAGGGRPPKAKRGFHSPAVEAKLEEVAAQIPDSTLRRLFENCYPNTLDTTVTHRSGAGGEDTFIITGDIPAMWLRDSTAQTLLYLPLAAHDAALRSMFRGLIRRQAACIHLDPYANAFYAEPVLGEWRADETDMKPGVHERKWEIDSLCYPVLLAHRYWSQTGDRAPFDAGWHEAARLIVSTLRTQQRLEGPGPYRFARKSDFFYDNSPNRGLGNPTRKNGLVHSAFRPSDDCCFYPFLIPSNLFAHAMLGRLAELAETLYADHALAGQARQVAAGIEGGLADSATCLHPRHGQIYAFEADGYGNVLMMDDANMPSLLSLPYLGLCQVDDPLYQRTRAFALSMDNPYFHKGRHAEGVGGPHVAPDMIWPLSIILRALTSRDDAEIVSCLRMLKSTDAGTGFMHESFNPDDPAKFSRPWFAWCNSMFGELIVRIADTKPGLLRQA